MTIIVQKYGGTSVANIENIINVAINIAKFYKDGYQLIIVVSAMAGETNRLIDMAKKINNTLNKNKELDALLATGEQVTASLLTMALHNLNIQANSYCGWQIPFYTTTDYTQARITTIATNKIFTDLAANKVVIITGFQGVTVNGDITTLGRGGSDTSAVALAIVFQALECQIYTDVNGIYNADPNKITLAKRISQIHGMYMLEASSLGANVLHVRSCELAYRYKMNLRVLSSFAPQDQGSIIMNQTELENYPLLSIAVEEMQILCSIKNITDLSALMCLLYSHINLDMLQINQNTIMFITTQDNFQLLQHILKDYISHDDISFIHNLSKISLIGSGFRSNMNLNQQIWQLLSNVELFLMKHNEISMSFIIHNFDALSVRNKLTTLLN